MNLNVLCRIWAANEAYASFGSIFQPSLALLAWSFAANLWLVKPNNLILLMPKGGLKGGRLVGRFLHPKFMHKNNVTSNQIGQYQQRTTIKRTRIETRIAFCTMIIETASAASAHKSTLPFPKPLNGPLLVGMRSKSCSGNILVRIWPSQN